MKIMIALQLLMSMTTAHAAKVSVPKSAGPKIQVACVTKLKAEPDQKSLGLHVGIEDFCACVADNHAEEAKRSISQAEADSYLSQITAIYEAKPRAKALELRAKFDISNQADLNIQTGCDQK